MFYKLVVQFVCFHDGHQWVFWRDQFVIDIMYKVTGMPVAVTIGHADEIFGVAVGIAFPEIAAELLVVVKEALYLFLFPSPELFHPEDVVGRSEEDGVIPKGVILDVSGKGGFYFPEKTDLVGYVLKTIGLDHPA